MFSFICVGVLERGDWIKRLPSGSLGFFSGGGLGMVCEFVLLIEIKTYGMVVIFAKGKANG